MSQIYGRIETYLSDLSLRQERLERCSLSLPALPLQCTVKIHRTVHTTLEQQQVHLSSSLLQSQIDPFSDTLESQKQ